LLPSNNGAFQKKITNTDKLFLKRIEDLEKFLKNLCLRYEFWTEQVLDFLNVPEPYQLTLFEEKERMQYRMKKAKKGNDKKAISRAKSYAERPSNYGSIQEEDKVNEELGEALHLS
jgi:hypothetical protein